MTMERFLELINTDMTPVLYNVVEDVHAMQLLCKLANKTSGKIINNNRVCPSSHGDNLIWFDVEVEDILDSITDEQVIELVACGVYYSEGNESLFMMV